MKTNIFTKILALSIFIVATFFGFLASPASATVPANTADYYTTRISDGDRNVINPILDKNCGKLNLGGTDVIVGDCSWFRNTFYLYKYLGQAGFMPSLGVDANSSSEIRAAWTKVRDLYGSFSRSNVQNGYQYINWKLNPDSSSADLYVDKRTACEIDPTGVGCDQPPPVVAGVCDEVQERSGVFLLYAECAPRDVYDALNYMADNAILTSATAGSSYLSVPKEFAITSAMSGTFGPSEPWYFAWQYLRDFYLKVSAETTGANHDSALQSYNRIKTELEGAQTSATTTYCTGETTPASGTSVFYKTVSSGSSIPGITTNERFVVCYASDSARIGSSILDKIKSVPSTSQYYIGGADYLVLPKNMTGFVFNPTDQTREITAWGGVIDAYTKIESSAKTQGKYTDEVSAQASILNIRQSIATGSRLAFTVSTDGKYFIVDQTYTDNTIPPEYIDYLKTNLIALGYSDGFDGVLRNVSPTGGSVLQGSAPTASTVPAVTNDLQAEAITSAQNLYTAIRNAAPAYDGVNYGLADAARANLAAAVARYRDQQRNSFFLSPVTDILDISDINAIKGEPGTIGYLSGDILIIPRVISESDIGDITNYIQVSAWQAIQKAYIWIEGQRPDTQDELDAVQSETIIQMQIEKFIGAPGEVSVTTDKSVAELGDGVNIFMKYNNEDNEPLKYDLWISDKNENDVVKKSSDTVFDGQWAATYIWQTSANTAIVKHRVVIKIFYSEGEKMGTMKAMGEAFITIVPFGQLSVIWNITPSVAIKVGETVNIGYTINGHDLDKMELWITDCGGTAWLKDPATSGGTTWITTDSMTGTYEWVTTTDSGACQHDVILKMIPQDAGQIGQSKTCVETYDPAGSPKNYCNSDPNGVPVTPPTGGTTEVSGADLLSIVGKWLGRANLAAPLKANNVRDFLIKVIEYWFPLLIGFASFIGIVVGGLQYISSAGDDAKAEKGKKTLLYSVVGIVLAISSIVIVQVVIGQINKDFK